MRAIFKDDDDRWTYVQADRELDLGHYSPSNYIWADGQQVCSGGGFRGDTLSWPHGRTIISSGRECLDRAGQPMTIYDYEPIPDAELLHRLAAMLGAIPYKSRATYTRHYWPKIERLRKIEDKMYAEEGAGGWGGCGHDRR